MQVELIRFRKKTSPLFTFTFAKRGTDDIRGACAVKGKCQVAGHVKRVDHDAFDALLLRKETLTGHYFILKLDLS